MLCAGCPHRGVFYTLSKLKLNVLGDIGCYTLGAVPPLSAMDAVICMGASIGMAVGFDKADPEAHKHSVAVIGDSTFIHSGITGLIDAVYNKARVTVIILDNRTTGMTGHQEHPATGKTIKKEPTHELDLAEVCRAVGVEDVVTIDPATLPPRRRRSGRRSRTRTCPSSSQSAPACCSPKNCTAASGSTISAKSARRA